MSLCDENEAVIYAPRREVLADADRGWDDPLAEDLDLLGGSAALSSATINRETGSFTKATSKDWPEAIIREHGGSILFDVFDDGIFAVAWTDSDLSLSRLESEYGMATQRAQEERSGDRVREQVWTPRSRGSKATTETTPAPSDRPGPANRESGPPGTEGPAVVSGPPSRLRNPAFGYEHRSRRLSTSEVRSPRRSGAVAAECQTAPVLPPGSGR